MICQPKPLACPAACSRTDLEIQNTVFCIEQKLRAVHGEYLGDKYSRRSFVGKNAIGPVVFFKSFPSDLCCEDKAGPSLLVAAFSEQARDLVPCWVESDSRACTARSLLFWMGIREHSLVTVSGRREDGAMVAS